MGFSENVRGSLYMMLAMLGFTVNDLFIKSLNGDIPIPQVMWIRGLFLSVILFALLWHRKQLSRWRDGIHPGILLRALCEAGATLLFLTALVQLPFATLVAILQSLPLVVTVGAALFLHEPVGWRRWLAIGIGFIGVLIIIRPGMGAFHIASVLVCLSVLCAASRDLITRRLPSSLPALIITASSAVFISVLGMGLTLAGDLWVPLDVNQVLVLALAAGFLFFGYHFIVLSMRIGEVAYIVPYRYTNLIWAIILGYLIFGEVPDSFTVLGSGIVIAMGLYTLYREVVSRRNKQTSPV